MDHYEPGKQYENDPSIEGMWAIKAHENSLIHINLLCAAPPRWLRLSPVDDQLYEAFRRQFPDFRVDIVDEMQLKSPEAKMKWRKFTEDYRGLVGEDFNFGTLLRHDSSGLYDSVNTILVAKIQFLAIEVARNKEGWNDRLRDIFPPKTFEDHFSEAAIDND